MQVRSVARQLLDGITRPRLWLTLGVCAVTLAARRPDLVRNPQFWAEDGHFYFAAMTMGWKSLFDVYAGYLHTVPRLVALAAAATDPLWAPAIFVTAAAAFTLYVAARTQSDRCPLPRHAGVAFAVVLVPDGFEVLLNIVNLQWVLAGALLL